MNDRWAVRISLKPMGNSTVQLQILGERIQQLALNMGAQEVKVFASVEKPYVPPEPPYDGKFGLAD